MKFEDHDLLFLNDVQDEPYELDPMGPGAPVQRISQPWVSGLNNSGLLEFINIPHFGQLNEAHACVKQILAYFHGGMI